MVFRGAIIRHFDWRRNDEGGQFTRIHVSADFTEPIREVMEWGEVQEGAKESKLEGSVTATHLILTPNGRELKQHELQISAQEMKDFKFVKGKTNETTGKTTSDRLDFIIVSAEAGAAAKLEAYGSVIGKGVAQLRVGYEEQSELDIAPGKEDDEQERLISAEQAEDTAEDDTRIDGPTLAPAVLSGGTHQSKGRRDRPARNRAMEAIADGTAPLEPVN